MHDRTRTGRVAFGLLAGALLTFAEACAAGVPVVHAGVPTTCAAQDDARAPGTPSVSALPREPTQRVMPVPLRVAVRAGDEVRVRLDYQVLALDPAQPVSGLGVRLHFDAHALRLLNVQALLAAARIGADRTAQPDLADADADPRTDSVLRFAWADIGGRWDVGREGPATLVELVFVAGPRAGETDLHVTSAGTAPGMAFASSVLRICVSDRAPDS
jgi:hypothetical protein